MTEPEPEALNGATRARLDEALATVEDAGNRPPAEQIEAYEAAHEVLQETLATIDEA